MSVKELLPSIRALPREEKYRLAQELLAENAFSLPVYYNVNPIVTSKKLVNFKASGTNLGSFWNVYEWYLGK